MTRMIRELNLKSEAVFLLRKGHFDLAVKTGFVIYVTWQTFSVS